jgi:hypothetical protein
MPILSILWGVLTSKFAGPIAAIAALILAVALGVSSIKVSVLRGELTSAQNTVGQLKGSLDFQNQMVTQLGTDSATASAAAKSALEATRKANVSDAIRAAALVAMPVPADPAQACTTANDTIKSFFDPQPKGAS